MSQTTTTTTMPSHPELGTWADGPLELLTTPLSKDLSNKSPFVKCASEMAVVHNMIIRGFNSVVLQAPNIKPEDVTDFANYALMWHKLIKEHHDGEEAFLFVELEKAVGAEGKDMMEGNVEQHKAFHDGLEQTHEYLTGVLKDPSTYSGSRLVSIMESYGEALRAHLEDEIPTLVALEKFGDKVPLEKLSEEEGKAVMGSLGMLTGLVFCLTVTDITHENGLWKTFPPIPFPVKWMLQNVLSRWHSAWWKFSPCDAYGNPKKMYAVAA